MDLHYKKLDLIVIDLRFLEPKPTLILNSPFDQALLAVLQLSLNRSSNRTNVN